MVSRWAVFFCRRPRQNIARGCGHRTNTRADRHSLVTRLRARLRWRRSPSRGGARRHDANLCHPLARLGSTDNLYRTMGVEDCSQCHRSPLQSLRSRSLGQDHGCSTQYALPCAACFPLGIAVCMPRATPLSEDEVHHLRETDGFPDWNYVPPDEGEPFEYKASDWGWLSDGRLVALDYSAPALD
jgi:hypothetical protein